MITKYSNVPELYHELFLKATERLAELKVTDDKGNAIEINSLEEYFQHLKDLIYGNSDSDKGIVNDDKRYLFLKLPLDEPHFIIDANSREIDTSKFDSVLSVQDDEVAEIVFFEIDRFFDATDLSIMQISIQWQTKNGHFGHTPAFIRDIDSKAEDDKLIFGWPITSEITSTPGVITFSVRFYDTVEENGEEKIIYSLSTLPKKMTISEGLSIDVTQVTSDDPSNLILGRLQNSPRGGIQPASIPHVVFHNGEIYDYEVLGSLEFYALATRTDSGYLSYKWYKNGEPISNWLTVVDQGKYIKTEEWIEGIRSYFYKINNIYEQKLLYTASDFTSAKAQYGDLYVECVHYSLPADTAVKAGSYYVDVENSYYDTVAYASQNSEGIEGLPHWIVIGATDIEIINNLPEEIEYNTGVKLTITANGTDSNTQYIWFYRPSLTSTAIEETTNSNSYNLNGKEGYYKVKIINKKNGEEKMIESIEALVLNPIIDFTVYHNGSSTIKVGEEHSVSISRDLQPFETIEYKWMKSLGGPGLDQEYGTGVSLVFNQEGAYYAEVTIHKGSTLVKTVTSGPMIVNK